MAEAKGTLTQILGNVIDVQFPAGNLPDIFDAIRVPLPVDKNGDAQEDLILEVELMLGEGAVRCVAMDSTDGLSRGMDAFATGAPISVPVGMETLGRVFNVLGRPIDNKPAIDEAPRHPIHASAPDFENQSNASLYSPNAN